MTAAKSGRGLSQRAVVAASAEYASGERGFFFFVGVQAIEVNAEQVRFQRRDQVIQCFAEEPVSYTHLTLPTTLNSCRSRWSPYH